MSTSKQRARTRLLFDENLPWRVPAALQLLELRTTFVGDENASPPSPPRGSTDEEVLEHALRTNQVIVTSNLDMVLLCAESQQSVVWIDPYGRQFRREALALLVFKSIDDWSRRLVPGDGPKCLRALRTRTQALDLQEAEELVLKRMRQIRAARRTSPEAPPLGPLSETWGGTT
ncbi:DUF5615 family PIN-like protein [Candidatus Poriferisodalis sp.]|uniref:DUF5615 family PIN-like protein n=1 Tax=Candidatus Poriferisodalis sp. TaxID=3101277 RepID=UPI003B519481